MGELPVHCGLAGELKLSYHTLPIETEELPSRSRCAYVTHIRPGFSLELPECAIEVHLYGLKQEVRGETTNLGTY